MSDALTDIFTDEIIGRLRKCAADSASAEFRLKVISASNHGFDQEILHTPEQQIYFRTHIQWNRWIASAISAGLFQEPHGSELRSRLAGIDPDGFRSALAECMTCWALAFELALAMQPRPAGRNGRVLEFAAQTAYGEVCFEVKSPRVRARTVSGAGHEQSAALEIYSAALTMRAALRSANRQFARVRPNILVLAFPGVDRLAPMPFEQWSASLIRAFYGELRAVPNQSGTAANRFLAEGNFLKQPAGVPRYTRISAVIALKAVRCEAGLQTAVLHNPCSCERVDPSLFGSWRQFAAVNDEITMFCSRPPSVLYNSVS